MTDDPARYRDRAGVYRFPHDRPFSGRTLTAVSVGVAALGVMPLLTTDGGDRAVAAAIGIPFALVMGLGLLALWKRRLDVVGRRLHRFNGLRRVRSDAIDLDVVVTAAFLRRRSIDGRAGPAYRQADPARIVLLTADGSGHRGFAAWTARHRARALDAETFDRLRSDHGELGAFVVLIDDFGPRTRPALLRFLATNLPEHAREPVRTWT